jgi:predicted ribosomally synthesized peptide with SipW-like signal peptide
MSRKRQIFASITVVAVAASVVGGATFAAFSSTTQNSANDVEVGNVYITDNDAGGAMLSLTDASGGSTTSGCILVTYAGSLPANVRLYGSTTGDIAPYLTLTVTRGTDNSPAFPNCGGSFTPDATNYIGQGAGVVYQGTLSAYPTTYAAGVVDASGALETWTNTEAHAYKFTVTMSNDPAGQGKSGTAEFTWESRNQ